MESYRIITDATADLTEEFMRALPEVSVLPMHVTIGGRDYLYGPNGDISCAQFYALQRRGLYAKTSGINPEDYYSCFESYLKEGQNVLYLGFSSGLSGTLQKAELCAQELRKVYPQRKIVCLDTLCASLGEAFLVREAARRQAAGMGLEELCAWVYMNRLKICHWFTVDSLDHLHSGGRIPASVAVAGSILQIKPLLHMDEQGRLTLVAKPRGRRHAIRQLLDRVEQLWRPELGRTVIVGHGGCAEEAFHLCSEVLARLPQAQVHTFEIGPIIGAHAGPGLLALLFWGRAR